MNRNLAQMGESAFMYLCNTVNIVATTPKEDKYGWDYFLEFPNDSTSNLPSDSQESAIECKVQIKATDINDGKCQIKLSAMLRLVKAQMPTFVCFINFNKLNDIQELFLVHIDEVIISKVLKRVREIESKNKKINRSKITLHYNNTHQVLDISGLSLLNKIKEYIPNGMNKYIKKKNNLVSNIGFSKQPIGFKMIFPKGTTKNNLIDMSLGLKELENVTISEISQTRFNIELPFNNHPFMDSKNTIVSITPQSIKKVVLLIKKSKYATPLEYTLDLYTSPFNKLVNSKGSKLIFKNELITFTLDFITNDHKFIFNLTNENIYDLNELLNLLKLVNLSHTHNNKALMFELKADHMPDIKLDFSLNATSDIWMLECYNTCNQLFKINNTLELINNNKITIKELEENISTIETLYAFLFAEADSMELKLSLDEKVEENKKIAILIPSTIFINNTLIGILIIFISNVNKLENNKYSVVSFEKRIYETIIMNSNSIDIKYFSDLADKIGKELEGEDIPLSIYLSDYLYIPKKENMYLKMINHNY